MKALVEALELELGLVMAVVSYWVGVGVAGLGHPASEVTALVDVVPQALEPGTAYEPEPDALTGTGSELV